LGLAAARRVERPDGVPRGCFPDLHGFGYLNLLT
jgi:hypothetical protein